MLFLPSLKKSGHLDRVHMTVCIVGSRKIGEKDDYGSQGWDIFAPNLTIYGFDADAEACKEANAGIEARQLNWNEKHIPLGIGKKEGKATLYVTKYPGCSSLYPPSEEYINRFSGNSELIKLVSTLDIETTTLDAFCKTEGIQGIDFIQLDVQGAELDVLQGTSEIVDRSVLGILTEVEFTEIYAGQPMFGDVDVYLRKKGFKLFDLGSLQRDQRREIPIISKTHPGALIWTDAFYFRDLIGPEVKTHLKTPDKMLKLACLADLLDFPDYALEILEFLTLNYGSDQNYNFANNIIESLAQVPELVKQGLESLPVVARIREYISDYDIDAETFKAPIQEEKIAYEMKWKETFTFKGKSLYYNRIPRNNVGERAIEIPIGFNFLATLRKKDKILEVGNVLSLYENSLSEHLGIRQRHIVDKFETGIGVDNVDLMELPSEEKYDAIVSISTVEHIGQGVEPSGGYGERIEVRDREAPLKAIGKIYDLLNVGGKALITVPFGKLIDGGWYIQFSQEYLRSLANKYRIPPKAISKTFMREIAMEINAANPREIWVEVEESKLWDVEYNWPWPCANAIAVLELTKLEEPFTLNLDSSPLPLQYSSPIYDRAIFNLELIADELQRILEKLREVNLIFFPDWSQPEETLYSELSRIVKAVLTHPDKSCITLLVDHSNISEEDANLALSGVTMNLLMQEDLDVTDGAEISLLAKLSDIQWAALLPRVQARIILEKDNSQEVMTGKAARIPSLQIDSFSNKRAVQLETGAWDLR